MDTRKVATEYRLAQWAQAVQTRQNRGQSIKDFCNEEGISKNTYFYWQRKLRETACEIAGQTVEGVAPIGWSRLSLPLPKEPSLTVEINGCRIEVGNDTDPALLANVCRALKTL